MSLRPDERRLRLMGGLVYLLALEYFFAEQVAAAAWGTPSYSWASNYISDLGITSCSATVCSPRHVVMNLGFVTLGVVVGLGSWLLRNQLFSGRTGRLALCLMSLSGVGDVLVGLFPGSVEGVASGSQMMHTLGAGLAITCGNAGILLSGVSLWPRDRFLAGYSTVSGVVGLAALAFFVGDAPLVAEIGVGAIERIAADPIVIWMVVLGAWSLSRAVRERDSTG